MLLWWLQSVGRAPHPQPPAECADSLSPLMMSLQPVGDSEQSVGTLLALILVLFSYLYVAREVEYGCMQNQLPQVTPSTAP
jgi:hypothetical protein